MAPEQVVTTTKLPPGFELSVFAAEPDVQNPIAITTDERGRLWVAENYSWSGAAVGGFDDQQRDRIVILEDINGDGRHDKRTVFWDDARKLTSIEVGNGGVWAISLPYLLFLPDENRDDIMDGPPRIKLDGIDDDAVGHTPANGLKWGSDGWLYARHGIQATSNIGRPGAGDSQRIRINTGVWRYHPASERIETVMHGMTNSWGFDFDQYGHMFVINTVIGHLWHVVPGAHVQRMYGVDLNPHAYQLIEQTADHVHWDTGEVWHAVQKGLSDATSEAGGGHAHIGLMIYQGDNWPSEYRHRLFTLNLHGSRMNSNSVERQSAGYVGKRAPDICFWQDAWFRGMDLITGPDGGVFIADWSDTGECHDHDGVHRTSGRIYKLTYGRPRPIVSLNLSSKSDRQLLELQSHANAWWARTARRLLSERYSSGKSQLEITAVRAQIDGAMNQSTDLATKIRLLETCYGVGAADESWLTSFIASEHEQLRVAALRLLVDQQTPSQCTLTHQAKSLLVKMAHHDRSGLVQLYLASALQRLPANLCWQIAKPLASRSEFAADRMFPSMLWFGVEPIMLAQPAEAIELARQSQIPLLTENIARRLTLEIDSRPELLAGLLSAAQEKSFSARPSVLHGMAKALNGWHKATPPANWAAFEKHFVQADSNELQRDLQALRLVFGDGRALEELTRIVEDGHVEAEVRRQALRSLLNSRPPEFATTLIRLLGDRALVGEAIRGLALYDHPGTSKELLGRLRGLTPAERAEVIHTLASRPTTAKELLQAVRNQTIAVHEISAFHARQIRSFDDDTITQELIELWGDVRNTAEDKKQQIEDLKSMLTSEVLASSDLSAGRALFQKSCASCHVLYGVGVKIGPDLTGSHRRNLDYLLENIVDPSASVGAGFRMVIALTEDGRVINGVIVASTERTLTLQTANEAVTLDRQNVESLTPSNTSLMPDGILQDYSPDQIRDLIGYLMSTNQVSMPE
ncbi:MAG: c-type cytochrome [Pirellulaceae bacterium]|nr:c-type cytochrome [Pirellulaceae bacterium]